MHRLKPLRLGTLALVLLAACAPAGRAGSPVSPPGPRDPRPGQAFYDTWVRVDPAAATLDARSALRFVADERTAREVGLLLNRGLTVREVRGAAVRSFRSARFANDSSQNLISVELEGVSPGSVVSLEVVYGGKPAFSSDSINGISAGWVELALDSQWYPGFSSFDRQMTGTLRVELPPGWSVVGSGAVSREAGAHVIRNTVPQIDIAFAAAPAFQEQHSGKFTVFYRRSDPALAAAVLGAATACGGYLDRRYGARDTLPQGKFVLAERSGPGYARKNYIVLSQVDAAHPVELHWFLCHELAHYWTADAGVFSPDHWMMEAFAEYTAGRFVRERFGQAEFDRMVARWAAAGRTAGPVWTPESTRRPSGMAMYRRAPYILSQLEQRIGTGAFDRFLARYMTERITATPVLLDRLREIAGADAEVWFREELARPAPAVP
ncbi:MAG TPA: hypothetical protein VJT67_03240 [Longimicrobiaceae bacterium]|nr:hypothetical protein [Longimicrobiaceae bacterium]